MQTFNLYEEQYETFHVLSIYNVSLDYNSYAVQQ